MAVSETIISAGSLESHRNWVTTLACPTARDASIKLVSGSRDNTLVAWVASKEDDGLLIPTRRLEVHKGFISDVALTSNATYLISASWDRSLRLWDLRKGQNEGQCMASFRGHENDVLSVAMSLDNRYVLSGGRDGKLKMWSTSGECIHTLRGGHSDWISSVRFAPVHSPTPTAVTGSWDHLVKVWAVPECRAIHTFTGHKNHVNTVTVSPDGSLCASAGKDGLAKVWDMSSMSENPTHDLDCEGPINSVIFSPTRYWVCAASESSVRIWNLESGKKITTLIRESDAKTGAHCTSLAWSADGNTLYSGYTDKVIRVWNVNEY